MKISTGATEMPVQTDTTDARSANPIHAAAVSHTRPMGMSPVPSLGV